MTNQALTEMSYEEWCSHLDQLLEFSRRLARSGNRYPAAAHSKNQWAIGDAWNTRRDYRAIAIERKRPFTVPYKTLCHLGWIASRFDVTKRIATLTYSHHVIVSSLLAERHHGKYRADATNFLAKAVDEGWKRDKLQEEVRRFKYQNEIIKPRPNLKLTGPVKRSPKEPVITTMADLLSRTVHRLEKLLAKDVTECVNVFQMGYESRDQLTVMRVKYTATGLRRIGNKLLALADQYSLHTGESDLDAPTTVTNCLMPRNDNNDKAI